MNVPHVKTEVLTLKHIDQQAYGFLIPSYQRPYVWSSEEVLQLLGDIKQAWSSGDSHYFIGTVLSSKDEGSYELIDGQQRTTTLMLMVIAFRQLNIEHPLAKVAVLNNSPRLHFAIRDQVQQLLGYLCALGGYEKPRPEHASDDSYMQAIHVALNVLKKAFKQLKDEGHDIFSFADYLYRNVQWVNNIVPHNMNLNRLFATLNTSGVQLEQADILKAKLFKKLHTDKAKYDAIWMACQHLDNYFERNVRSIFPAIQWNDLDSVDNLAQCESSFYAPEDKSFSMEKGLSIAQLYEQRSTTYEENELQIKVGLELGLSCRSIVSFPLLLIHTYRIFLAKNAKADITPRLHQDHLLAIFEPLVNQPESEIKCFLELLWKVRFQFDKWVVKWFEEAGSGEEHLTLTHQYIDRSNTKNTITRTPKAIDELMLLQSVRYFTGERSAQYWLTPFLVGLLDAVLESEAALKHLESIDNQLSMAAETQKEASFQLAQCKTPSLNSWSDRRRYLNEAKGTSFEHYWFQKLEYVLWKRLNSTGVNDDKFKKYRITSKNSVEHISPQNNTSLSPETLHSFGNLVLLSPSQNSAYSDKPVPVKRAEFAEKPHLDTLKSREIFQYEKWTKVEIEQHKVSMLELLKAHYKQL